MLECPVWIRYHSIALRNLERCNELSGLCGLAKLCRMIGSRTLHVSYDFIILLPQSSIHAPQSSILDVIQQILFRGEAVRFFMRVVLFTLSLVVDVDSTL